MANNSSNFSGFSFCIPTKDSGEKIAFKILAYCTVLFVALVANVRVISLVLQNSNMRRKTINLFVVNMAISDLLISLFAMPRTMIDIAEEPAIWYVEGNLGDALCKVVFFVQDVATAVSIESLIVIACDRYFALAYPMHAAPTSKRRLLIILTTWFVAVVVHFPYFFTYKLETFADKTYCINSWSPDAQQHLETLKNYYFSTFTLFVAIPIVLLTGLYSAILFKLKRQGYLVRSVTNGTNSSKRRREYHVLKMAISILIGFAVCWVPFNTYVFIIVFIWKFAQPCSLGLNDLFFFVLFMAYSNSALNPCIYIYFSRNFQKYSKRHPTHHRGLQLLQHLGRIKDQI